jgi:DNA polymerase I-like protein with 3'-5' exonuclease and polymerase domains
MTSPSLQCEELELKPNEFLSKAMLANVMSIDTETNGGDVRDGTGFCVGISAAVAIDGVYYYSYFPVAHFEDNVSEETKQLLFQIINSRQKVVMHNAKFDIVSLKTAKFELTTKWYCTMLMTHFLNENIPKGLDWLARYELKISGKVSNNFANIWSMKLGHMIPVAEMRLYAGIDAVRCLQLFERMYPYFVKAGFDGPEGEV